MVETPRDCRKILDRVISRDYEYLLTYLLHGAESPSWQGNWFAASQQIPRISQNPNVHYRTHKRPPPVSILGQPNPVHIPTSHLLEIHPNIIHHLRLGLPSGLFTSGFPSKTLYTPLSSPIRATCPAHLILLDFPDSCTQRLWIHTIFTSSKSEGKDYIGNLRLDRSTVLWRIL